MHKHVGKCAKMQRNKESPTGVPSKQGKHNIAQSEERVCIKQTNITKMCSYKWLHPNEPQEGQLQPHEQVAPKTNKHKPMEGTKHNENLDLAKQTWI